MHFVEFSITTVTQYRHLDVIDIIILRIGVTTAMNNYEGGRYSTYIINPLYCIFTWLQKLVSGVLPTTIVVHDDAFTVSTLWPKNCAQKITEVTRIFSDI